MTLLKGFAWITFGRLLAALLQAVSLVLVARYAGPDDFGVLAAYLGFTIVIQATFDLGISTHITKRRAHWAEDPQVAKAIRLYRYLGMALLLVLSMAGLIISHAAHYSWWLFIPLALSGCLERQSDVRLTIALADGDVWKNATNLVARRSIALVVLLMAVQAGWSALSAFSIASVVAASCSYMLSNHLVKIDHLSSHLNWPEVKKILGAAGPFWANSLGAQLRNLDVLLVGFVASAPIAGYYGAVSRSVSPLRMVSSSLAAVILPMVARRGGQVRSIVGAVMVVIGTLAVAYMILAVFAREVVLLLLGSEYLPAAVAFQIVMVGLIFASSSSVFTSVLQAKGYERIVGMISIATSLAALVGVVIGVMFFKATGAALGLSISYVVQCAALALVVVWARNTKMEK